MCLAGASANVGFCLRRGLSRSDTWIVLVDVSDNTRREFCGSCVVKFKLHGPLAHLVERYYGIVEVAGSSPARSTKNY